MKIIYAEKVEFKNEILPKVSLLEFLDFPSLDRSHTLSKLLFVPTEPITTTGEVLKIFSDRAFQVALPNGKEVIAHPAKSMFERKDEIVPEAKVTLEMTPFDFEKARISDIL